MSVDSATGSTRLSRGRPGVLFVGAGMVSELHHRAITIGSHLRLVGVYDVATEVAERRARDWGCRAYPTLGHGLEDPEVEAVFVLAPAEIHAEVALACLRAGKHVLVEKPVASCEDVSELEQTARGSGLVCMPGHNYAYQPEFRSVLRLVKEGSLGKVRAAWLTYVVRHPESVARAYGSVLEEVMVHHTYLALALFGSPNELYAGCMEPAWREHSAEDQAWMTWHYHKGLSVHHFATFAVADRTSNPWLFSVKVLGESGSASYNWHDSVFERALGTLAFAVPAYEDSYIYEHDAFALAMAGDQGAIVSPVADAREAARVLQLAREASERGASVRVAPEP